METQIEFDNTQQQFLFGVLTTDLHFSSQPLDLSIFQIDLVIRATVPENKYIAKAQDPRLNQFVYNPDKNLSKAYEQAYNTIFKEMQANHENKQGRIQVRNAMCLSQTEQLQTKKKRITDGIYEQQIVMNCSEQFNGILDSWSIKYNTLIYLLQQKCGFQIYSFLCYNSDHQKQIYILIGQSTSNLMKAADRYGIKKQIDYTQIDLFVNDPVDAKGRPLKYNSNINNGKIQNIHKQIARKLRGDSYYGGKIMIEQAKLNNYQIQKYQKYQVMNQQAFQKLMKEEQLLLPQEKKYLFDFNRGKINAGCEKVMIQVKKRKKYFEIMKKIALDFSYSVHNTPISFFNFVLNGKKKKFFEKLRSVLLYKPMVVSPYGDLSLFLKMQRIKICYLVMKEYLRVENLHKIGCQVYALSNEYQLTGKIQNQLDKKKVLPQLSGGLDGKNLTQQWSVFKPWKSDIRTVRNYLGEQVAHQILIKNHLIIYFILLAPIGVLGQILTQTLQSVINNPTLQILKQFYFHLGYFIIIITIYNIFLQLWRHKEAKFISNYVENNTKETFRLQYSGPFVRNPVTDVVNEYQSDKTIFAKLLQFFFILLICTILGLEAGFFYGMRWSIVRLVESLGNKQFYIISGPHLIAYGIFFVCNLILYKFIISWFLKKLCQLENLPTEQEFTDSQNTKTFLFWMGIQLLGPIFILIIQPFSANQTCLVGDCYQQYVVLFGFLALKLLLFLYQYCSNTAMQIKQLMMENREITDFQYKLNNFIKFIQLQGNKQQLKSTLLHYAIFATSFPLCPLFAFGNMILEYYIERIQILKNRRRPISKSCKIEIYSQKFSLIMHLSIFINVWLIFYSLNFFQLSDMTIKIVVTAAFIVIFEIVAFLVRKMTENFSQPEMQKRKQYKYKEYIRQKISRTTTQSLPKIEPTLPLKTIFRTFHPDSYKCMKGNDLVELSGESQGKNSSHFLKIQKQEPSL